MELKGPLCYVLDFDDIYDYAYQTAKKVKKSGWKPDAVIGIARGGWVHARIQCDLHGVKNLFSVKVDHWGVTATKDGKAKLTSPLTADVTGKKVLVIDDITDTGKSLTLAVDHLKSLRSASDIQTATLLHIKGSDFIPNYYGDEVEWAWFTWPWNYYEDMTNLVLNLFEGESTDRFSSSSQIGELLNLYNEISLSEEQLSLIKDHMIWLDKLKKATTKEWQKA